MRNPETNPFSLFFNAISENYSGIIAILLVSTACYLWLNESKVPQELINIILIVVSFLFGKNATKRQEIPVESDV